MNMYGLSEQGGKKYPRCHSKTTISAIDDVWCAYRCCSAWISLLIRLVDNEMKNVVTVGTRNQEKVCLQMHCYGTLSIGFMSRERSISLLFYFKWVGGVWFMRSKSLFSLSPRVLDLSVSFCLALRQKCVSCWFPAGTRILNRLLHFTNTWLGKLLRTPTCLSIDNTQFA